MPPRGEKKGSKRARQYEHIKKSEKKAGRSEKRAEQIAARAVNKEKSRSGESRSSSPSSTRGRSASSHGGKQSGKGPGGRTREQLYNDARKLGIEGRSRTVSRRSVVARYAVLRPWPCCSSRPASSRRRKSPLAVAGEVLASAA